MSLPHPPRVRVGAEVYPALVPTDVAASWLGTTPHRLRERIDDAAFPVQPVRMGHRYKWPTLTLARAAGLDAEIVTAEMEPVA
jgi:hypothetical protein